MKPGRELFDPFQGVMSTDPYPEYRRYLEAGSIHRGGPPMPEFPEGWYVVGYPEARSVLGSRAFVHDRNSAMATGGSAIDSSLEHADLWAFLGKWFLLQDPPPHTTQRALVSRPFRADAVQQLEHDIAQTASALLDRALGQGGFDLMWEYAYPLSLSVITRVLGIPVPDLHWFKACTRSIAAALSIRNSTAAYAQAALAVTELNRFLRDCLAEERSPTASPSLLDELRHAAPEGHPLADDDLLPLLSFLLFAGQETASDAIGNGVFTLFRHPAELARLVAAPSLMPAAVEEILRFEAPVQYAVTRTAATDTELGGVLIGRGDPVTVVIGAASRDARRYPDPDRFDISRASSGDSLVFGRGIHVCLGIHLARLTLRIAFHQFLARLPNTWRIGASPVWRDNISLRGPASLEIIC